jgi:hypothetical protein
MYGARSTTLWQKLHRTFGEQLQSLSQPNGPALWKFTGMRDEATKIACVLGSEIHEERGEGMLASLPSLAEAIQHLKKGTLPNPGERWKFFQVRQPARHHSIAEWVDMPRNQPLRSGPGLYRTTGVPLARWVHVFQPDGSGLQARALDERNPEHGLIVCWFELGHNGQFSLKHNTTAKTLAIPAVRRVPLPVLVDRALRLASGTSPDRIEEEQDTYLVYKHITLSRARQVGRILGLQVETWHG